MSLVHGMVAASMTVLLAQAGVAQAVDYQAVVAREFPGYFIIPLSEIDFAHADRTPKEIQEIRDSANLLIANLNNDGIPDFAATIRNAEKKHYQNQSSGKYPGYDYYTGGTVACLSTGPETYHCMWLGRASTFILPHNGYLAKMPQGTEMECLEADTDPYTGKTGNTKFRLRSDAIADAALLGNAVVVYVPKPDGTFYNCVTGD